MYNSTRSISKYILVLLGCIACMVLNRCRQDDAEILTIAAASSMQFALDELVEVFEKEKGIPCNIITGASGMLTAQISEGAPYDVFLSADLEYPAYLYENNFASEPPFIFARGILVIWSVTQELPYSITALTDASISKIAIPNPEIAPYGKAAMMFLSSQDIADAVKNKLVYGESVSQVNQFIASGAVSIGFTAKSVLFSPEFKDKGMWAALDDRLYAPINHGALVLTLDAKKVKDAKAFTDFLRSKSGRRILEKYGYQIPNHSP
ncbi:molybdate ABC transporter substrate-binding protein [Flavobacteriaceae bacterium M23B6Z8]